MSFTRYKGWFTKKKKTEYVAVKYSYRLRFKSSGYSPETRVGFSITIFFLNFHQKLKDLCCLRECGMRQKRYEETKEKTFAIIVTC